MTEPTEIPAIRSTRRRMSTLMATWLIGSIVVGLAIYWLASGQESASRKFGEAFAAQFVIWGAIDLVFAILGVQQARRADASPIDEASAAAERADCDKLIKTLKFNSRLNWVWIASGMVLLASALGAIWRSASGDAVGSLFGHAAGVLVQGGFLFWFDRRLLAFLQSIRTSAAAA